MTSIANLEKNFIYFPLSLVLKLEGKCYYIYYLFFPKSLSVNYNILEKWEFLKYIIFDQAIKAILYYILNIVIIKKNPLNNFYYIQFAKTNY